MANIEMYGYTPKEGEGVEAMVYQLLESKPYKNQYVTTYVQSIVSDHSSQKRPFLRIVSTSDDYLDDLIETLKILKIDLEIMIIDRFISS